LSNLPWLSIYHIKSGLANPVLKKLGKLGELGELVLKAIASMVPHLHLKKLYHRAGTAEDDSDSSEVVGLGEVVGGGGGLLATGLGEAAGGGGFSATGLGEGAGGGFSATGLGEAGGDELFAAAGASG